MKDIKITFVDPLVIPPLDVPKEALNAGIEPDPDAAKGGSSEIRFGIVKDASDHGTLSNVVAGKITALSVTWAQPKYFQTEEQTRDFLWELLSSTNTQTWTYHVWSYVDSRPDLVATVKHTTGMQGKWLIWRSPNVAWAYQDGGGKWWWGMWDVLKAPRPKSLETGNK